MRVTIDFNDDREKQRFENVWSVESVEGGVYLELEFIGPDGGPYGDIRLEGGYIYSVVDNS